MTDQRRGIVLLKVDGREVALQFTWRAIDSLGRNGVTALLKEADSGEAGEFTALADLLVAASAGALTRDALLDGSLAREVALSALIEAWLLALHGPKREPEARDDDPQPQRPRILLKRVFGRLWASTSAWTSSSRPRPTLQACLSAAD